MGIGPAWIVEMKPFAGTPRVEALGDGALVKVRKMLTDRFDLRVLAIVPERVTQSGDHSVGDRLGLVPVTRCQTLDGPHSLFNRHGLLPKRRSDPDRAMQLSGEHAPEPEAPRARRVRVSALPHGSSACCERNCRHAARARMPVACAHRCAKPCTESAPACVAVVRPRFWRSSRCGVARWLRTNAGRDVDPHQCQTPSMPVSSSDPETAWRS